jgi:hypothetical protein
VVLRQFCGYLIRQPLLRKLVATTPLVRSLAWRYLAGENLDAGLRRSALSTSEASRAR